jgi:hypothetical protein
MALVSDIINQSMTLIGAIAAGETPSVEEYADALLVLNDMLSSWDNERLSIFAIAYNTYLLANGTNNYTIGVEGSPSFNSPRPMAIKSAVCINVPGLEFPIKLISAEEWAAIPEKTVSGTIVRMIYNDGAYPNSTLYVWPQPASPASSIGLFTWQQFVNLPSIGTAFDMPPGYQRAIRYNLAMDLLPEYPRPMDQQMLAGLVKNAADSKQALKDLNLPQIAGQSEEAISAAQVRNQIAGPQQQAA